MATSTHKQYHLKALEEAIMNTTVLYIYIDSRGLQVRDDHQDITPNFIWSGEIPDRYILNRQDCRLTHNAQPAVSMACIHLTGRVPIITISDTGQRAAELSIAKQDGIQK